MKIVDGFLLRHIGKQYFVVPTGANAKNINGAIELNEVAACIWEQLQTNVSREHIIATIVSEFRESQEEVTSDVDEFLEQLRILDLLID